MSELRVSAGSGKPYLRHKLIEGSQWLPTKWHSKPVTWTLHFDSGTHSEVLVPSEEGLPNLPATRLNYQCYSVVVAVAADCCC